MNFSSASSCFHNLFSGQPLWLLQCPRSHWHVKAGSRGKMKEHEKQEEVSSLAVVAGQLRGGRMCCSLGSWVMFENTTGMCAAVNGGRWQVSLGGSQAKAGCLSLEKLPNPLCQFGSCCWCMMGKKDIPPSLSPPLQKAPWPEYRFRRIILAL